MASFELLFTIDRLPDPVVKRFDAVSGTYLGSFGLGYLQHPAALQVRNGVLYVLDSAAENTAGAGRIHKFNPNTGEALGTVTLSSSWGYASQYSSFDMDPVGNFYVSDYRPTSSFVNMYTPAGGYVSNFYWPRTGGTRASGVALDASKNRLYISNYTTGNISVYDSTNPGNALQTVTYTGQGSRLSINNGILYANTFVSGTSLARWSIGSNGLLTALSDLSFPVITGPLGAPGFGHNPYGFFNSVGTNGTTYYITRFNTENGDYLGSFGSANLSSPTGNPVLIIAPEPSTGLAALVGLALLRRRSDRKKAHHG